MDNHLNSTYQERMNQTVRAKLDAVLPHLEPGMKLLDFGSGFSPEFTNSSTTTNRKWYNVCDGLVR